MPHLNHISWNAPVRRSVWLTMQGGAVEGTRIRTAMKSVQCENKRSANTDDSELITPPLDVLQVENEIQTCPILDYALLRGRELFALSLATPIAWIFCDATVAACRERKQQRVKDGASLVVRLQSKVRCCVGDWYFTFWSFFAEEDFYLLSLPILFWNADYRFARHMTYIVTCGLLWGNLLKDVFRLPRPKNVEAQVWVPKSASGIDSTACRDFGFPSTHAMNSVSNSVFTVMYCLRFGLGGVTFNAYTLAACALFWICSISFGRVYLGVHSPMDVKGGLFLGIALAFIAGWPVQLCDRFDHWMLNVPHVGVVMLCIIIVVLCLNPQPRPMTPTFLQNCTCCGLFFGCSVGFRMETDRRAGRDIFTGAPLPGGYIDLGYPMEQTVSERFYRTVFGFVIILLTRVVVKKLLVKLFRCFGLDPVPNKPVPRKEVEDQQLKAEIKGWDLWAAAMTKSSVYAFLAWVITCGCPVIFDKVLGLPTQMNG